MEQLVNFIIRPPRAEYDPKNDLLDQEFMLKGKWYHRKDVAVVNSRRDVLQCSHYMPLVRPEEKPLPCVIYCHGNSGCRADASEAAIILLPLNITVFTLDFSGSGLSGGEHVSLGWHEKDDLKAVVDHLRDDGNVSLIGLWGRSMGAVTSLLYGAEDPSIAGMVLDSPFSDLVDLMMELVDTYKIRLPKFTVKFAIQYMRRAILKKAKFDITDLNTIKVAKSCFVPALFGHAADDDFILPHHSDRIFDAYAGDKNIIKFEGDHNSPRPQFYFDSISIFFNNVLQPPMDEVGDTFFDLSHEYIGKGRWNSVHEMRDSDDLLTAPSDPAANSTENAIEQLRSRRPMSRIEVPSDISSKDKQESQDDDTGTDSVASSSNMISFELSNGNPYGPHVPASIEDDEYVEYALDDLGDFPSNVEEEERMFMEAIIESLKDLEVKKPHVEDSPVKVEGGSFEPSAKVEGGSFEPSAKVEGGSFEPSAKVEGGSFEPSAKDEKKDSSLTTGCSPSKRESTMPTSTIGDSSATELSFPDTSKSSGPPVTVTSLKEAEKSVASSCDTSATRSSSNPDTVDQKTKATITVEKNPTSNIMDGLLRRWDLNFFRNR